MKHLKITIFLLLLAILIGHFVFRIFSYSKEYTAPFDADYWKDRYFSSQWAVSNSKNPIGDDGLYAYVSWELVHGADPVLIANAEAPPLGKYIIGVGEVVFQNQNILNVFIGILCLSVFFLINLQLFKNKLIALLPVFLFSFEPIFYTQIRAPYLDNIYLMFLLLTLLFVLKRQYFLASFFLGCFTSTKYPVGSVFLFTPIAFWVYLFDRKRIKTFLLSLILWPAVFLLSYSRYFMLGHSLREFGGVQKWILQFYMVGAKATPGIVYPMIFTGNWYTWFGGVQKISEWNFLWPVSLIGSVFSAIPLAPILFKKIKDRGAKIIPYDQNITLILLWVASYLVFLTFTPVFPRYLLLLLPFMYNLTVWFLVKYVFKRF